MPVRKGKKGKWRIGKGKAMYKSKKKALKAYRAYLAKKRGEYKATLKRHKRKRS